MDDAHSVVTHIVGILRSFPMAATRRSRDRSGGKHPVQETDRERRHVVVVHVDQDLRWHGASGDARHQHSLDAPGVQNATTALFRELRNSFRHERIHSVSAEEDGFDTEALELLGSGMGLA